MAGRKTDIEKYLRGELTPSEMHALEKEALHDPFLADALEGIDLAGHESFLFDVKKLNRSVKKRSRKAKAKIIFFSNWSYGVAASVLLVAASAALVINIINNKQKETQLALNKEEKEVQAPAEEKKLEEKNTSQPEPKTTTHEEEKKSSPVYKPLPPKTAQEQSVEKPVGDLDDAALKEEVPVQPDVVAIEKDEREKITEAKSEVAEAVQEHDKAELKKSADIASAPSKSKRSLSSSSAIAPTQTLSGKVTAIEDGAALPGVNVIIKGTSIGTVTDVNGDYKLSLPSADPTLVFNFIGLKTQEVRPDNKSQLNVAMDNDASALSEVVVTAYGIKQSDDDGPLIIRLAEPSGGRKSFQQYLKDKLNYPKEAIEKKIEGRVTVQFSVDTNGTLGDFKVLRSLGGGCDEEVIRLIKQGPPWSPTQQGPIPIKDTVKVRLKFSLPK